MATWKLKVAEENLELELDSEPLCGVVVMEGAVADAHQAESYVINLVVHLELAMRALGLETE